MRRFESYYPSQIRTYEQLYDNYNEKDYSFHMAKSMNIKEMPNNFLKVFFEELKDEIPPKNENLINTISQLYQEYELVLLTNYFSISQINRLNSMGIGQYFIECYGEKKIKPNKKAYIDACGKYSPSECVMIGDDIYLDIERAQQEGLNTIFVNSKKIEINKNIGIVVNSVEEISIQLIGKINNKKI